MEAAEEEDLHAVGNTTWFHLGFQTGVARFLTVPTPITYKYNNLSGSKLHLSLKNAFLMQTERIARISLPATVCILYSVFNYIAQQHAFHKTHQLFHYI